MEHYVRIGLWFFTLMEGSLNAVRHGDPTEGVRAPSRSVGPHGPGSS